MVNTAIGFMNAIQFPAVSVTTGKMVPKDKLSQVSGMNSFSNNLMTVLTPVFASAIFAFGGLKCILLVDLAGLAVAFLVLLLLIPIQENQEMDIEHESAIAGCRTGFRFLQTHSGLWIIVITMAVLNFFSRLTYENILSPMILARSGNNSLVLGTVTAMMGIGGIMGGVIVSAGKGLRSPIKMIYVSAAISFLAGDLLMGVGQNVYVWSFAGIAESLPIPFVMAGQNVILYNMIPENMQGRVFAVRNAIQYSTIPVGILLGGFLADFIFEPFMKSEVWLASMLSVLVGTGDGSGMAFMFLGTGISGSLLSCFFYSRINNKAKNKCEKSQGML